MTNTLSPPHFTQKHPAGFDELVRLASAQPIAPACDHFYFLRHGQTGRNASRIFQDVDEPLSEIGLQQAARAAERLAGEPIRTVVCSDARRAYVTAQTVATGLGLVPEARDDLRTIMHELKHAVIAQGQENHPTPAKLEQIRAILRQATADIAALA